MHLLPPVTYVTFSQNPSKREPDELVSSQAVDPTTEPT